MDNRMTILVISCNKYKDIADQYLYYLRKNWSNCPFHIAVATEDCDYEDKQIQTIKCGKGISWTKEVLIAIEQIDTEIVLMTVDDLFICKPVESDEMLRALNFMIENNINYYRIPKGERSANKEDMVPGQKYISKIRKDVVYSVTIGSAMWRKDELRKVLGDGSKTAWELEDQFSEIAYNSKYGEYYEGYVSDLRPLLQCAHMITAGKWIPSGIKQMEEQGFYIDTSTRGKLSTIQILKMSTYSLGTRVVPKSCRKGLKKTLSKVGFKFATKY